MNALQPMFSKPKAANVPASAVQANTDAQRRADDQSRELARREAAARNARTRGRSLLLFDAMTGVEPGGLDPNRG